MFEKIVPLNSKLHAGKKFRTNIGYGFARQEHLTIVALHELPKISTHYPVLFIKRPETGNFAPAALLGVEPGENLFVNADGAWAQGAFIPSAFRRYPFALIKTEGETVTVCVADNPELIDPEHGIELFTQDGDETAFLARNKEFLVELLKSEMLTEIFCAKLVELELLDPCSLDIRIGADLKQFSGCFVVNETRLNAISPQALEGLREYGFLGAIYAHLLSLNLIDSIVARKVAALASARVGRAS